MSATLDSATSEPKAPEASAWPRRTAAFIIAVLLVLVFATFRDYGMSWDEQLQNTYGQKLLSYYTSGFTDLSAFSYINLFLYGGFFDLTAALLNLVSPFGEYETRHLLGGLIFIVGLIGGWKLTRQLAGERAALVALICLAATPLLYGHGFINPKDSPLAWLLIWATYYCCRILSAPGQLPWSVVMGFGLSLGLAIGTRVVGIVYLGYLAAVMALAAVIRHGAGESFADLARRVRANGLPLIAGAVLTVVVTVLVWPWVAQMPLNVIAAGRAFSHFAFYPNVLWNGALIRADEMPRSYLPGLLVLQLPEYVLLGIAAALAFAYAAARRRWITVFLLPRAQSYLFLTLSIVAPVAGYFIMHPTVYNGLRHFLFVVPPLVIVGAIGLEKMLTRAWRRGRAVGAGVSILLALAVLRQAALMAALHPYEYVSYNIFTGGVAGAANRFELDYWGTTLAASGRALGTFLAQDPKAENGAGRKPRVFACGDRTQAVHALPLGTVLTEVLEDADFYLGMEGVHCEESFPRAPVRIAEVRRLGTPLGYVLDLRAP